MNAGGTRGRRLGRRHKVTAIGSLVAMLATLVIVTLGGVSEAAVPALCATPGKDGSTTTLTGVVNTYYPGTASAAAGGTTLTVGTKRPSTGTAIANGDLLLVIQMQDSTIDTSNSNDYGANNNNGRGQTAIGNTGKFEYVKATSAVNGSNQVTITGTGAGSGLLNAYTNTAGSNTVNQRKFQVIRVPQYANVTMTNGLTASPWDGSSGGVLAVDVAGTFDLNSATASVSGQGFRGGAGRTLSGDTGGNDTDYVTQSSKNYNGQKAEGTAGTPRYVWDQNTGAAVNNGVEGYNAGSAARGAPGNAGGGGTDGNPTTNDQNTGGGGGGNGGIGGKGGNAWTSEDTTGGVGGAVPLTATVSAMTAGGGGGAGTDNNGEDNNGNIVAAASAGATGGGIAFVRTGKVSGTGTINASGSAAYNDTGRDGAGGGGAGGAVMFTGPTPTGLTINASGGRGGDAWRTQAPGGDPGSRHGPGGGGAGGAILTTTAAGTRTVTGGAHGITTTANDAYGSTDGAVGSTGTVTNSNIPGAGSGAECSTDLSITKTGPAAIAPSGTITYSLLVANNGSSTPTTTTVVDTLPAGTTIASIARTAGTAATCTLATATCTISNLAPGATTTITVTATVTASSGNLTNTATVSSTAPSVDINPSDNTSSSTAAVAANPVAVNDAYSTTAGVPGNAITRTAATGIFSNDTGSAPLTLNANTSPTKGTLTLNTDGSFVYTPNSGVSGTDSFTYSIKDTYGRVSNTATVNITINPVAVNNSYTITAGQTLPSNAGRNLLTNDIGTTLTANAASGTTADGGTFSVTANGQFVYTPITTTYSGIDTFTYTAKDSSNLTSNTATVTINVTPIAANDTGITDANTPLTVAASGVLTNDTGTGLTATPITNGPTTQGGTVTLNANGSYVYTPPTGFSGTDTFTYTAKDADGQTSNTATVTITVRPVAVDNVYNTNLNTPIVISTVATGVLGNDIGNSLSVTSRTAVSSGTVSLFSNANGTFTYTPALNFVGVATFTYTLTGNATSSGTATVRIYVGTGPAPVAVNDSYSTSAGTQLTVPTLGVLTNDTGTGITANPVTNGTTTQGGTYTLSSNGALVYNPPAGYSGPDSFPYTITDTYGRTSSATVNLTVTPKAVNDTGSTAVNTVLNVTAPGVLTNDVGSSLTATPLNNVLTTQGGRVTLNADGSYAYTPATNFSGIDTFTYTAKDSSNQTSNTATVTITVIPKANNDTGTTSAGTTLNQPAPGVLSNDVGTSLTANTITNGPTTAGGTVTLNANGSYAYNPPAGFSGTDTFTYTAKDSAGTNTNTATVTITVTPKANNDTGSTSVNTQLTVPASGVLANDVGSGLTATPIANGPTTAGGTVTLNANGSYVYNPPTGFSGIDTFTYTAKDSSNQTSNTATVTINVLPKAVNDTYAGTANTQLTIAAPGVLSNDLGTGLTANTITAGPTTQGGTVTLAANGSFVYNPPTGLSGSDTFTYTVKDSANQNSNTATVTITLSPKANNDSYTTQAGTALPVAAPGVLTNDIGTGLTANAASGATTQGGTYALLANGSFNYTPPAGFSGTDTYTYSAKDSSGTNTNTATVTITVTPKAVNDTGSTNANTVLNVPANGVLANDIGSGLTATPLNNVLTTQGGRVTLNANGSYAYTPPTGFSGTDTFTYTAKDSSNQTSNVATVTITVLPRAANDTNTTAANTQLTAVAPGVLSNDTGSGLTANTITNGPTTAGGTVTLIANGSYVYNPPTGFSGTDTFTYTAKDSSNQTTNSATVTITVTPKANNDTGSTNANTQLTVPANGVLGNDIGSGLTATPITNGPTTQGGTVTLNANGSYVYNPPTGFSGTDTFTYTAKDSSNQTSNVATVTITVLPRAVNDTSSTAVNTQLTVPAPGVLSNDIGSGLTATAASGATSQGGTYTLSANGSYVYNPATNFSGIDTFTYTAKDSSNQTTNTATVTITVTPKANNDAYTTNANTALPIAAPGVLSNDVGTGLTANAASGATTQGGTYALLANGSFNYTPPTGFSGTDTYTYTAKDSAGTNSNTATVTITVKPRALDDTFSGAFQTVLNVPASGVLGNDIGSGLVANTITAGPTAHGGTVTLNANGSFSYTPPAGYAGPDTFTYTAHDSSNQTTNVATVTINVGFPPLPVSNNNAYSTTATTVLSVPAPGVMDNDTGYQIHTVLNTNVAHGVLVLNPDGSLTWDPQGYSGTDSFTYHVVDAFNQSSNVSTVTLTSTPVAVNNSYSTTAGTALPIAANGVLGNDVGTGLTANPIVAGPTTAGGTVTLNANGSFNYTPPAGFSGTDTYTYTAKDASNQTSNVATVTITVFPKAVNDTNTTPVNTQLTAPAPGVLGNDLGTGLVANTITNGPTTAGGTVTLAANGSYVYNPPTNFSGIDTFTYTAKDSSNQTTNTATVTITVTPTANNDTNTTPANTQLTAPAPGVLSNDVGSGLTANAASGATTQGGTYTLNANGSYVYNPPTGFSGTDTFTYTAKDSSGTNSNTATVTITVTPRAIDNTYSTGFQTTLNTPANGVLGNDIGSGLTATPIVAGPTSQGGTVTLNADGSFTYIPAAGFTGADTFTYTAKDSSNQTTNVATVTINVGLPAPPVAVNDAYSTNAVTTINQPAPGILGNDSGYQIHASLVTGPGTGSLTLNPDGSFIYDPQGHSGPVSFTYKAIDAFGQQSNIATVNLTITPVAVDDSYSTSAGTPLSITAPGVLVNDVGTGLTTIAIVNGPTTSGGTVSMGTDGSFTYNPPAGYSGSDSFTYTIKDSAGQTTSATVHLTVTPKAVNDSGTTPFETVLHVGTPGVLSNDVGSGLTANAATGATTQGGSYVLNANGSYDYTPPTGFSGVDTFTYTAKDVNNQTSNVATVTINVTPIAVDDSYATNYQTTLNVPAAGVLTNDHGSGLTAVPASGATAQGGSYTLNADGSFTYNPPTGFGGVDSFPYTAKDSANQTSSATVTITIGLPAAPVAVDNSYTTTTGTAINVPAPGVLGNDSGTGITVTSNTNPSHGTVTQNADGSLLYTPAAGYSGPDSYTYTITDAYNRTASATVFLTITPVAVDNNYTTVAGHTLTVPANGVLGNDKGTGLQANPIVNGPTVHGGTVTLNADGSLTYNPPAGYSGPDSFTYTATDSSGQVTNVATVSIDVTNQPPVAVNDTATTGANTTVTVDVLANDSDPDGHALTIVSTTTPSSGGTATIVNNKVNYTPPANFTGYDVFNYTITDGYGGFATASVRIYVGTTGPGGSSTLVTNDKMAPFGIGGRTPGAAASKYDQTKLTKPLALSSQTLVISLRNNFMPVQGDVFDIVVPSNPANPQAITGAYSAVFGQVLPNGIVLDVRYLSDRIQLVAVQGLFPNTTADLTDTNPGDGNCLTSLGNCSLRAAVQESNAHPGGDAVVLAPNATYPLTIGGTGEDAAASGDLDLTGPTVIVGQNGTINGNGIDRVLHAQSGATYTDISNLTVTGGSGGSSAGGIQSEGSALQIIDSTFTGNAGGTGGGIGTSSGSLNMVRGRVASNNAGRGAGVAVQGTSLLDGTTVESNTATQDGGGVLASGGAALTMRNVTDRNNNAGSGGGLAVASPASATVSMTTFASNTASSTGGGILAGGTTSITDARVMGNTAPEGAGATSTGTVTFLRITFDGNNASSRAGAILTTGGALTLDTSTLSGNQSASGSALVAQAGTTAVVSTTITANTTTASNGAAVVDPAGAALSFLNSIVADQASGVGCSAPSGGLTSNGYNHGSDTTCGFTSTGDVQGSSAKLAPIAYNGGYSPTHLPQTGSPVINTGQLTCVGPDQRSFARPRGGACEKGSVEK